MKLKRSKSIQNSPQAAFTLIEMLVVVFVVGIGLIGALSFFNININNQNEVKNELIAAGLAQEGADLVRNLKDSRTLNKISWQELTGQVSSANDLTTCDRIDYQSLSSISPSPRRCNNGGVSDICFSGGRYQQCASSGTGIGMTRELHITYDHVDDSLTVKCTVSWKGRSTISTDVIYNNVY